MVSVQLAIADMVVEEVVELPVGGANESYQTGIVGCTGYMPINQ